MKRGWVLYIISWHGWGEAKFCNINIPAGTGPTEWQESFCIKQKCHKNNGYTKGVIEFLFIDKKENHSKEKTSNIWLEEFDVLHSVPLVSVFPFWKRGQKRLCSETQMFGSAPLVNPSSVVPRLHLLNESTDLNNTKGFSALSFTITNHYFMCM